MKNISNSKWFLSGTGLFFLFAFSLSLFGSGWFWSNYDEPHWIEFFLRQPNPFYFISQDWHTYGRIRPLIFLWNHFRLFMSGLDVNWIRAIRIVELFAFLSVLLFYFRKKQKLSWIASCFLIGFLFKSPPILDQIRLFGLSELSACTLLVLGLYFSTNRVLSLSLLICSALFKETFWIFLSLPFLLESLSEKKIKPSLWITGITSALILIFLYFSRKGQIAETYAAFSFPPGVEYAFFRGFFLDCILLIPVMPSLVRSPRRGHLFLFSFLAFVIAGLSSSRADGYNYLFAPFVLCIALGVAQTIESKKRSSRFMLYLGLLALILPLRGIWNVGRVYQKMATKKQILVKLDHQLAPQNGKHIKISTNCATDAYGLGFLANQIKTSPIKYTDSICERETMSIASCCKNADYFLIGRECEKFDEFTSDVEEPFILEKNNDWIAISCKQKKN